MPEQLVSGDAPARKAYLRTIADAIVVSDSTIRSDDNRKATIGPNGQLRTPVRKSIQEWRSVCTENLIRVDDVMELPKLSE